MITKRAANEIASREVSDKTYWVGRVDRKIRHAADDGHTNVEIKFYQTLQNELAHELLMVTIEHGFVATMVLNDRGEHTMAVRWEKNEPNKER